MKSLQTIFDQVTEHLLTQQRQSTLDGTCQYRTAEGLTCAVGCLIDEAHYNDRLEGLSLTTAFRDRHISEHAMLLLNTLINCGINVRDTDTFRLLDRLQLIHDGYTPRMWRHHLKMTAAAFNLNFNYAEKAPEKASS